MTSVTWSLVEVVAQLLHRDERDAVLGDLVEARSTGWQSLFGILGLVIRQNVGLWKSWRPWLAAFGLALPSSLLLMGFSISISRTYQQVVGPTILKAIGLTVGPGFSLLLCNVLLLISWSWTGGFVMGSVSRRTVWVSAALSFLPCLFCLERFRIDSLSRLCLLLFLPPAIWGVYQGLRIAQIKLSSAIILALAITVLTIPAWSSSGPWIPNWALSWPAWYLVAMARRPGKNAALGRHGRPVERASCREDCKE
jgi:hypothetical protein